MLSRSLMALVVFGDRRAVCVGNLVVFRIVAGSGTAAMAAYGIGVRFHMMTLMPAFALGGAAATMVGQNLGAGTPDRAHTVSWLATGVDLAIMAGSALILCLGAPWLIAVFDPSPDVVRIGSTYLRVVSPFYVFAGLGVVLGRALNGAGDTMSTMVITILTLWGLQVPLAVSFSRSFHPATLGIWWAVAIAITVNGLLTAGWFQTGRWKTRRV